MLQNILKNKFLSVSFFSAISSLIRVATLLIIGKVIALLLGPEGLALVGQLSNFTVVVIVLAGNSISQGVTKYIAEHNVNQSSGGRNEIISTAFSIITLCSIVCALFLIVLSPYLSKNIFLDQSYYSIFIYFGLSLFFTSLNNLLLAILNGHKKYKIFNFLNILSNIFNLIISLLFIYFGKLYGALLSIVINQSVALLLNIYLLRNEHWLARSNFKFFIKKSIVKQLFLFATLSVFSTALYPLVTIITRNIIIDKVSLEGAGFYELVFRISSSALMFFVLAISTYYIPRISEITRIEDIKKEVKDTYKVVIPLVFVLLAIVYFMRDFIIILLASKEFLASSKLFLFQLIGDFFKINAQVISFILVARAHIKLALLIEVSFNILYIIFYYFFINYFGLIGASYAYAFIYLLYLITFIIVYKHFILKRFK